MTRDELEFSISQYVDGTLADDGQRSALEERLATDAEARGLYAEYQTLHGVLATSLPMPEVDWDQFARRVSAAVNREEMPAQSYKIGQWISRSPMQFGMAASVLIAGAIALTLLRPGGTPTGTSPSPSPSPSPTAVSGSATPTQIVRIDSPASADAVAAAPTAAPADTAGLVVAIVPPAPDGDRPIVLRYADSVVQRPSRAMIVSAAPVGQDTSAAPF
jgi:negative regulator of sigma E activity